MALLWSNRITKQASDIIISRSEKLPIEPDWFMLLADLESGLDAFRVNPFGCYSWIQFCPDVSGGDYKTIKGRRYYFVDLKKMSESELLNLSFDYLEEQQAIHGRFSSYHDLYFSILYPVAIGKPDDYILNTKSNPIFDINKDQNITVGEVKKYLDDRVKSKVPTAFWDIFFKKKTSFNCTRRKLYFGQELRLAS